MLLFFGGVFLLLVYNWMPTSVKMFAAFMHSTHLCCSLMDMLGMMIAKKTLLSIHFYECT